MKTSDIRIRDPFVLADHQTKTYYLYGTTDENVWTGPASGFQVYKSGNLQQWEGPFEAFRPQPDFWANQHFWAPEVFEWQGSYYMLATFKSEDRCRGTQVLKAESALGPFKPLTDGPITPEGWECLDGTLFVDKNEVPWMVFCREWLQIEDGEMYAMPLSMDLQAASGEPILLFTASQAPWTKPVRETNYVTDGPFLYEIENGGLEMIWSSHSEKGYAVGVAKSVSGAVEGPWVHEEKPLLDEDGGHGMLFRDFAGERRLAIHTPNKSPNERAIFLKVKELDQ
ncbi:glycoside hydrolase family 43 protein [Domibacillus robiginosus]|uniref:glycoside hydrolase family 43 protein n=1 Tax=Domibacillus robiginosus TaxID=1071054 RepID=UPI00067DE6DA|nr:glycoside hydrolase family 43 protein [Domibacillus robiginosus]